MPTAWLLLRARSSGLLLCCPHWWPELHEADTVTEARVRETITMGSLGLWLMFFLSYVTSLY